jgi:antitoxin ParD1/3/4
MPKTASVTLGDRSAAFIERQIAEGHYRSESDVVQAGLTLLEERETKLQALRHALIEGEQSGSSEGFDVEEFLDDLKRQRTSSNG